MEKLSRTYNDPEFQRMRRKSRKRQHKLIASYLKEGKTLDIGFAGAPNQFVKDAIGIDLVKISKPENYSEVVVYDVNNGLPFPEESFDNIIASEFVEHIENPSFLLRECHRVLVWGGD